MSDNLKGIISDIHRTSVVDGPGIRTAVFLQGCPLRCIWCHNPETQQMKIGQFGSRVVELSEVVAECKKDLAYYNVSGGGVTISGGEPLMQPLFTLKFLQELKKAGIHTALDTSGYASRTIVEKTLLFTDLYLFDYKVTDPLSHSELTKRPLKGILDNLEFLLKNKASVILRCPLVPGVNDQEEHLQAIAGMGNKYPSLVQVDILPWHSMGNVKYIKLGRKVDSHLPRGNVSKQMIDHYRAFFIEHGCSKVVVRDR
ncbi:4Fe-4S cluster-binding domain-containing protein [Sunxiuqinia indica]|uniref:4Fe-4S cluster-binding domain-containing protein n=1 Tax=Sunxiuqinia indica TaxID=2692584 RepID=UPI0013585E15|nr:4Fe-4S cluster-binding domain-containing protein [Sunxiuqinia indica]